MRRGAWAVVGVSLALLVASAVITVAAPVRPQHFVADYLPNVVLAIALPTLGAVVLSRLPRHRLGRLWLATGLAGGFTLFVHVYAELALNVRPGRWPLGLAAAWVSSWVWVLGASPLLTLGLLLFPDGRLPSRRWRFLLVVGAGAVLLPVLGQALQPGQLEEFGVENPLGVAALGGVCAVARGAGFACFTLGVAGGAASIVHRWRRGDERLRQQLTLPALAAGLLGVTFLVPAIDPLTPWLDALGVVEVTLLFAAFAVAVLRDHVVGAEVALRRSLVYGFLTGGLIAAYSLAVAGLAAALPSAGASLIAGVGTALVALPLRDRLQAVVTRSLYGDRDDPISALARLHEQLDAAADPAAALAAAADAVRASLRLSLVRVLVEDDSASPSDPPGVTRLPLVHRGELVGTLLAAPRAGATELDERDLRLLGALQRQAAAVVAAMRLSSELQRSRERLVAAREEERRRLRRDLHDGLGPTLAGIGLGLQVAAAADDPADVRRLIGELTDEATAAVTDVRRLVEDLRPPALDELGLAGALHQHTERLSRREADCTVTLTTTGDLTTLPAAVEVAAYRIAMEALNNALRHGRPRRCTLSLDMGDVLEVAVADDGSGLPARPRDGVGLRAMRERAAELGGSCTVTSAPDGGTRVLARLPVDPS